MAPAVQTPVYGHPAPSLQRHNHNSSMNDSFSQPVHSFDSSRSLPMTVSATPPPRATPQSQMSFNMSGNMGGLGPKSNSFTAYGDVNGNSLPPSFDGHHDKPHLIYTAVYSNVSVYEMEVNGTVVMRRRSDNRLNATQILKVAGIEKGKRTKVLDKEILNGEHEKVQGGYGKYQGTWIKYERGVEFCRQYGVEELLRPLLEYDMNNDNTTPTQNRLETPTKEQAMAAQRKRMYNGMDNRPSTQGPNGTYFKNMSSTAANAINALSKTRFDSPVRGPDGRRSAGPMRPSQQFQGSQESAMQSSQQSMASMASQQSQDSFSATPSGSFNYNATYADFPSGGDGQEPPRKKIRPSPQSSFIGSIEPSLNISMLEGAGPGPEDSFMTQHAQSFAMIQEGVFGLEPLPAPRGAKEERTKELLVDLFLDNSRTDFSDHPAFLTLSGDEFEIPIDNSCNTALHWAATLAQVPLVKQLIAKGFNVFRTNSGGETALIAACHARNNHDRLTFPELLELLGPTIEVRDGRGRTLLHHIAVSSAMRGRAGVGRYYLESLLEFVVCQGSSPSSQNPSFDPLNYERPAKRSAIGLARFMAEIVNAQDKSGDTALNLAARTNTKSIIQQLLEVGADTHLANNGGLSPLDFGVKNGTDNMAEGASFPNPSFHNAPASSQASFADAQSEILNSIRDLFAASETDFTTEIREKQEKLNNLNLVLKEKLADRAEQKHRMEELHASLRAKQEMNEKIANLTGFIAEIKAQLPQSNGQSVNGVTEIVVIGEADRGLTFDERLGSIDQLFPESASTDLNGTLTTEQQEFLSALERPAVLQGRVKAYQQHNADLEKQAQRFKNTSQDLEERYRKIVSRCTQVEVDKVDEKFDSLLEAVESEQKDPLELGKVRQFLQKAQGSD